MDQRHDPGTPSSPVLRAEPHPRRPEARVRGVEASSGGLIRATLGSAAAAGVILALFWLPAEYGIDPTGLGRAMGLTQMGEIKQQLYAEAAEEEAAEAAGLVAPPPRMEAAADAEVLRRLETIEAQLAAIAVIVGAATPDAEPAVAAPTELLETAEPEVANASWRHEETATLAPGEGIEIKLAMAEGGIARFEWSANGAVLNYDTHGDGGGQKISYEKGRAVPGQVGTLAAAFSGNHGWFWRNRTDEPVVLTLRVAGDYSEIKRFD